VGKKLVKLFNLYESDANSCFRTGQFRIWDLDAVLKLLLENTIAWTGGTKSLPPTDRFFFCTLAAAAEYKQDDFFAG